MLCLLFLVAVLLRRARSDSSSCQRMASTVDMPLSSLLQFFNNAKAQLGFTFGWCTFVYDYMCFNILVCPQTSAPMYCFTLPCVHLPRRKRKALGEGQWSPWIRVDLNGLKETPACWVSPLYEKVIRSSTGSWLLSSHTSPTTKLFKTGSQIP